MAHISYSRTAHGPAVADEWLGATARATQFAGKVARRPELAVKLGPGFAAGAGTAQFAPRLAEIEVDTQVMCPGVDPEEVDPFDDLFRERHPVLIGALIHEAAHARYSRWVPLDLMGAEFVQRKIDVLVALEESRIERYVIADSGGYKKYLGSVVFDLIAKDFTLSDDKYGASIGAALTLARVDAGSITEAEGKPFREALLPVLGEEVLETLTGLWREYQSMDFPRWAPLPLTEMDSIATRWIEALGMDASDEGAEGMACEFAMVSEEEEGEGEGAGGSGGSGEGEGGAGEGPEDSEGAGGSGEGKGKGSGEGEGGGLDQKIKDEAAKAKHKRDMGAADGVGKIKMKRRQAQREADNGRKAAGKDAEKIAYPREDAEDRGKGGMSRTGRSEYSWRKPSEKERAAGMTLSKLMEKVVYSDRRTARVLRQEPGGRLRGRGAMQRAAQKAAGRRPDAAAWSVKKRSHVDEPKMRVGVMLDVSGSMSAQARIASSLAYIVGNAVDRNGGDFGMTLFGNEARGVYRPGQKVNFVPVVNPHCGWENFTAGFHALDSAMDLVDGDGLRVLVLISDGVFVHTAEKNFADAVLPMLHQRGVVVLHVDVDGQVEHARWSEYNPRHNNPLDPVAVRSGDDPVKAAQLVGEHLIGLVKKFKGSAAA